MKNITGIFKRQGKRVLGNKDSSHKASQASQNGYSPIGSASTNSKNHTEKEKISAALKWLNGGVFPGKPFFETALS